ncbi:putative hydroxymethylpyrimidine transporter CytX [Selenomonas sp. oral taxon 136]|uniref:putative hydroxymethylpyrimidine transporter CytX n=1 Tax=Selenomonas sp. oral taxon 136 TaxID=713030 RepID=UPI000767EEDD|nr:putative hydroxymethylpyrimidine transporter CytX [Selenomonas sp. oral taxon 136]AME03482.1 nitrate reductase [Selenomonas sp. oral taxon 136]
MDKRTSIPANALIWFGAGVSLAEILTGTFFAPLGFRDGGIAIVVGHIIGCFLLFLAGLIGARTRRSAMETVKMAFGARGGLLFAALNVFQLVGWTSIMIYDGALAANTVMDAGHWLWCLVIGILIIVWIRIGILRIERVNAVAMTGLFLLTVLLCSVIWGSAEATGSPAGETMSFAMALELSIAMPLSWLPLISDYTREAERPATAAAVSALVYGLVSCWMYFIGMGAAILTGESDIAQIMLHAGLGVAGLGVVILSTVTTTYLDAYSAGVSSESIVRSVSGRTVGIGVTILGAVAASLYPMDDITGFLYIIGSVFAPMIAVQIASYFLLREDAVGRSVHTVNLAVWFIGFLCYRYLMTLDTPVGSTLPTMAITLLLALAANRIFGKRAA